MSDTDFAVDLARGAGALLREIQEGASAELLNSARLKDIGDRASQDYLAQRLLEGRPADAVLSEEAVDDQARLTARRVWIIDPLDGTREFSEGRPDWAVHVALWEDGKLAAGAVALAGIGQVISTADAAREWKAPSSLRMAVSRSRATPLVSQLASDLHAELVPMGSAGFKVGAVVRGEVDLYVHTGGQYEWDSAAPIAVAQAAGLYTSRVDGSAFEYNRPNPYLPDLVVCNPLISDGVMRRIDALLEGQP